MADVGNPGQQETFNVSAGALATYVRAGIYETGNLPAPQIATWQYKAITGNLPTQVIVNHILSENTQEFWH